MVGLGLGVTVGAGVFMATGKASEEAGPVPGRRSLRCFSVFWGLLLVLWFWGLLFWFWSFFGVFSLKFFWGCFCWLGLGCVGLASAALGGADLSVDRGLWMWMHRRRKTGAPLGLAGGGCKDFEWGRFRSTS